MALKLTSTAFSDNSSIPKRYTCDGENISPDLSWSGVPAGTQSLVLIVDDPDAPDPAAPKMVFVHWVLYNIPPDIKGLPENITEDNLPKGAQQGINDFNKIGYGGPCPPSGNHRYFHKLYALDKVLPDLSEPSKDELLQTMEDHVLDKAELIGTYER